MLDFVNTVEACLDRIIEREAASDEISLFDEFLDGTAWFFEFRDLCKTFASIADPDALQLIPELGKLFDNKAQEIKEQYEDDTRLQGKLLLFLSQRRKELGFDERERKIKKHK